jgi:hypothetical protein
VAEYIGRGCPGEQGKYPLDLIVAWVRDNIWAKAANGEGPGRKELAEIRKLEAQATKVEAQIQRELGQLVERAIMLDAVAKLFHVVRARLQAIPGEIASGYDPAIRNDLQIDVEHKIAMILAEMASWARAQQIPEPSTSGPSPANSKTSSKPAKRSNPSNGRGGSRGRRKT